MPPARNVIEFLLIILSGKLLQDVTAAASALVLLLLRCVVVVDVVGSCRLFNSISKQIAIRRFPPPPRHAASI